MHLLKILRHSIILFGIAILVLVTLSCESKVMQNETVLRGGILYQRGEVEPFTGIVAGKGRDGYRRQTCTYEKAYEKGLQHGETRYWYENGKLESMENYVNGELHGIVTRFYSSGKPKARIHFENGMRGGGRGEMFWDQKGRKVKR